MARRHIAWALVPALAAGCSTDRPTPAEVELRMPLFAEGRAGHGDQERARRAQLHARLRGTEEVFVPAAPGDPTPADSRARGVAVYRVSGDGNTVEFRLVATRIDNVIMAHIHCGPRGANGPIRMWLYPVIGPAGAPAPSGAGRHNGVLASGTFSPTGVVCPASAVGRDMPLLEAMKAGLTYTNVHTNDGVAPANTGPGDFPGGEIRGQLTPRPVGDGEDHRDEDHRNR